MASDQGKRCDFDNVWTLQDSNPKFAPASDDCCRKPNDGSTAASQLGPPAACSRPRGSPKPRFPCSELYSVGVRRTGRLATATRIRIEIITSVGNRIAEKNERLADVGARRDLVLSIAGSVSDRTLASILSAKRDDFWRARESVT
jgi:hypothetical protein